MFQIHNYFAYSIIKQTCFDLLIAYGANIWLNDPKILNYGTRLWALFLCALFVLYARFNLTVGCVMFVNIIWFHLCILQSVSSVNMLIVCNHSSVPPPQCSSFSCISIAYTIQSNWCLDLVVVCNLCWEHGTILFLSTTPHLKIS